MHCSLLMCLERCLFELCCCFLSRAKGTEEVSCSSFNYCGACITGSTSQSPFISAEERSCVIPTEGLGLVCLAGEPWETMAWQTAAKLLHAWCLSTALQACGVPAQCGYTVEPEILQTIYLFHCCLHCTSVIPLELT